MQSVQPESARPPARRVSLAVALLLASLVLAACGTDDDTTSTDAASSGESTVTTAESDAASAGTTTPSADPAAATDPSQAAADSDAAAAVPGDTAVVEGATPATGATSTTVDPATGTTTDPAAGTAPSTTVDPATGVTTTTPAPTTSAAPTGVTPLVPASPVLPGADEGVLSRPFNSTSPWNTPVAGMPTAPNSEKLMRKARIRIAQEERPDGTFELQRRFITTGLTVNVTRWTVPVFSDTQQGAVERIAVCRQFDCGPDAVSSVVMPPGPDGCPEPEYDGWMTVIDNSTRTALDFWRARCEADGSISYHYVKRWDLDGPGFQEPGEVSARGSGLPLFAGLITPEEIQAGRIDHALAISVPGAAQRRYVQPASRTDGVGLPDSLPEGARLRLQPGANDLLTRTFVRNGVERKAASTIITALERYGAIVVDRSAAPTMYAQRNANWTKILPLNLLQDIGLSRFDVVRQSGPVLFDPPKVGGATTTTALPAGTPGSIPAGGSGTSAPPTEYSTPDTGISEVIP